MTDLFLDSDNLPSDSNTSSNTGVITSSNSKSSSSVSQKTNSNFVENTQLQVNNFLDPKQKVGELNKQIKWVFTQQKSEYLPHLLSLSDHSSVSVRRNLAKGLGTLGDKSILSKLQVWQEVESDRETWLLLDGAIDKISRSHQFQDDKTKVYTVSEALTLVKTLIGEKEYTIEGELAEIRPVRQMYYFGIKDKAEVRVDCGCFAGVVARLGFPLNEGLIVRLKGKFRLSKTSRLYFDVKSIVLTGEGELKRNLEMLKQKLSDEGLLDPARKRKTSKIPRKILLLASQTSAAYSDFRKVLEARIQGIQIYFLSIKTQGVGAEADLLEKLQLANSFISKHRIETVVITRGGGSQDDLAVFNSEKVARAVHTLQAPVVVAIGHERDVTLAELVADVRASTPSNAAELVSLSRSEILSRLEADLHFFQNYWQARKTQYLQTSLNLLNLIQTLMTREVASYRQQAKQILQVLRILIQDIKKQTNSHWQAIEARLQTRFSTIRLYLQSISSWRLDLRNRLANHHNSTNQSWQASYWQVTQNLQTQKNLLISNWPKIQIFDPKFVLQKGYTLVLQNHKIIESKADLKPDQELTIRFQDGDTKP